METTIFDRLSKHAWSDRAECSAHRIGRTPGVDAAPDARERLALLAAFALLIVLRLPHAWLQGRFLGEEGTIFFAYAWHRPAAAALFRSFAGYLNLGANAATLADARLVQAGFLPLELAPYLTMTIALLVQLLPGVLIVTGRADWLIRRWAIRVSLLILAISPMTEEVFVNALHIQFHLALCAALILALDVPRSRSVRIGYGLLLFLAPLCGPSAIVLAPFYVLRCLVDRDRVRALQTVALVTGAAVQLLLFFTASPVRGHLLDAATLAAVLSTRLVVMPFFGPPLANVLGTAIYTSYSAAGVGWWIAVVAAIAYFGVLIRLALRRGHRGAIWLVLPGLGLAVVSFGGGMIVANPRELFSVGSGERYNFLPLMLLSLGLVALADEYRGRVRRFCLVLCLMTLVWGAIVYPTPIRGLSQGPAWADEVAAWRRDHDHPLATWTKEWTVDLSDHDRPCSPRRTQPFAVEPSDPSYCENAWLARVTPRQVRPGP
ncbi:hypothetical protein [uncultured Sphingomonas sp.]|uniref:hypothetical protein n=1 Tax=uncultured Sphingomonas sp. TaxID=158754 RepID=UPI0035CBC570